MEWDSPDIQETVYGLFRNSQVGPCVNSAAHDINNLLGAIMNYAELVEIASGLPEDARRMLKQVVITTQRCSALIQTLTEIARKEKATYSTLEIGAFVERMLDLRRYDFRNVHVKLRHEKTTREQNIFAHAQRLQMALLYLLANALEAVQGTPEAAVRVTTAVSEDSVSIAVWNSGPPIDEAGRERMFEPFFTTKGKGHLGLGLFLARGIAQEHAGSITYTETGGFLLRLPVS